MAADLHTTPTPGLRTQLCGDAHLSNFGAYASPERRLVFDINDFDETLPGAFEWDVKRLAASFVVAGRDNGFTSKQSRKITLTCVENYRTAMRAFADQTILDVWYAHLDVEDAVAEFKSTLTARKLKKGKADLKATETRLAKAHTRDSLQAIGKLTTKVDGRRRITSDPPLVVPIEELTGFDPDLLLERIRGLLVTYRQTLPPDRQRLVDHFTLADVAHKVVGVGSVGLRAWIVLLESGLEADMLLLQAKQAEVSVLADYSGDSEYTNQGERVVVGQHLMQASSDIFLGWLPRNPPAEASRTITSASSETGRCRPPSRRWTVAAWTCMPSCAAGHSPARTPVPVTASRSRRISATRPSSTAQSPTSPRPTPTRTNEITPRSQVPSPLDASKHKSACERSERTHT